MDVSKPCLTQYEVARLIGMRALELSQGAHQSVVIEDPDLRCDVTYVAAYELYHGHMRARLKRGNEMLDVQQATPPPQLAQLLDSRDGGSRPV